MTESTSRVASDELTDIICTYRWGSSRGPGLCQCQGWFGHDGSHRCCCGEESAVDDKSKDVNDE